MSLIQQAISFFNKPFPLVESLQRQIIHMLAVSIFVTLFLYVFEPFGLSNEKSSKLLICIGFGVVSFLSSVVYHFISYKIFRIAEKESSFTFGKWILLVTGLLFTIALANFLYGRGLHWNMEWQYFPQMIYATVTIGIFPTVILGGLSLLNQERKYSGIAQDITGQSIAQEDIKDISERSLHGIPSGDIRYVEAYQNYIKIGYSTQNGDTVEITERGTLKSVLSSLEGTNILKCHRSYLVNKDAIESASGNAQGLVLTLRDCDKQIPVSRSMVSKFR